MAKETRKEKARRKELEAKWGARQEGRSRPRRSLQSLGIPSSHVPAKPDSPLTVRCTYCGTEVDATTATHGTDSLRKKREDTYYELGNDQLLLVEEVTHYTQKVVACPRCCLNVEKVRFPETHG